MQRRDGDLYAAIPDGEIGKCRFIMKGNFKSAAELDASLEAGLLEHKKLMAAQDGGIGKEVSITQGFHRATKVSKLELGTWAERLEEMITDMGDSHSFVTVKKRAAQIEQWWDMTAKFMEQCSTPLREPVMKILKMTALENPFPEGMGMNWALDVQSAQTLDFLAGMHNGKTAWDLGTLTGVSAAVLSEHMKVVTVERETSLVKFARKHLPKNVRVVESEIGAFLRNMAAHGKKADFIFMDLDKPLYQECYEIIMEENLLKPGGVLVADNVLYRGLTMQHRLGEMPDVSEKTAKNAACLDGFLQLVRKDVMAGHLTSLMMPVRDGMLAVKLPKGAGEMSSNASTASTVE
jgi:caffeoyl-CoA O-methyltransferase